MKVAGEGIDGDEEELECPSRDLPAIEKGLWPDWEPS